MIHSPLMVLILEKLLFPEEEPVVSFDVVIHAELLSAKHCLLLRNLHHLPSKVEQCSSVPKEVERCLSALTILS
jgi:hypothetical protein